MMFQYRNALVCGVCSSQINDRKTYTEEILPSDERHAGDIEWPGGNWDIVFLKGTPSANHLPFAGTLIIFRRGD